MTFGNGSIEIRKAVPADLDAIKKLADAHRNELGFVMRPALERSIEKKELYVALEDGVVSGFVEYHHRRDAQTTLYHIAVTLELRHRGIGTLLVEALKKESKEKGKEVILLKCPLPLSANRFYEKLGWQRSATEEGRVRSLVVWRWSLNED